MPTEIRINVDFDLTETHNVNYFVVFDSIKIETFWNRVIENKIIYSHEFYEIWDCVIDHDIYENGVKLSNQYIKILCRQDDYTVTLFEALIHQTHLYFESQLKSQ